MKEMVTTGARKIALAMESGKLIKSNKIDAAKILAKRLVPQVPNRLTFLPSHPMFGLALFWMLGSTICAMGLIEFLAFHFIQRNRMVVITMVTIMIILIDMVLEWQEFNLKKVNINARYEITKINILPIGNCFLEMCFFSDHPA